MNLNKLETSLQHPIPKKQEKRSILFFLLFFLLLIFGLIAAGYSSFHRYEQQFRSQVESELAAVAELKTNGLHNWLTERFADAETIYENPVFAELFLKFLENPNNIQLQTQLQDWLKTIQIAYQYESVILLDNHAVERITAPYTTKSNCTYIKEQTILTLDSKQITFLDFHRDTANDEIHLSFFVPILDRQKDNQPIGVLVLYFNPDIYLYPFINQWPTPRQTAETLLVNRNGDQVIFLNELKYQKNTALNLSFPLKNTDLPAVQAVLGKTGIVEGPDYRGVPVVAYTHPVPDSPWFIVSKIDVTEVYAPLRERLWQTVMFFGVLIFIGFTGLLLIWRRQRRKDYQQQAKTAMALLESEQKYGLLFNELPSAFAIHEIILDPAGNPVDYRFLSVNPAFETLTGLNAYDILGKTVLEVLPETEAFWIKRYGQVALSQNDAHFESFSTSVGKYFEVHAFSPEEGKFATIFLDVSERKQIETTLHSKNEYLTALQETALDLIVQLDLNTLLENIVKRAGLLIGTDSGYLDIVNSNGQLIPQVGFGYLEESLQHAVKPGEGIAGTVWQTGEPLVVNDYDVWNTRIGNFSKGKLGAVIGVPLSSGQDVLGVLGLAYAWGSNRTFTAESVEILTQFAHLAALAIKNARLFTTVQMELSQRKQVEEELRETKDYLENLLEYANAPIIVWDPDFKITKFNRAFERLTNYDAEDMIGKQLNILFPVESQEQSLGLIKQTSSGERWETVEIPILNKDGSIRIALWNSANLVNPDTNELVATIAQGQDITSRKQMEESLFESEERFRRAVTEAPVPMMIHDEKDRILHLSKGWFEYSGYVLEDIPTMADWTEQAYGTRDGIEKGYIDDLFNINETVKNGEWIVNTKSGQKRIWDFYTTPIGKSKEGDRILLSLAIDITERKKAEEEIRQINVELEKRVNERTQALREAQEKLVRNERLATVGQIAGSVGHELLNPLGIISNALYYLKIAQPDASDKVKQYLEIIEAETRSSTKFINELLDFTRIKSIDRKHVGIAEIVQETLDRYPLSDSTTVFLNLAPNLPTVFVDPQHIVQVLGNLITNANQAMPDGGDLTISADLKNSMVVLKVQDTGTGIHAENLDKIFEPLFTTKIKGIGLGLAISKKLVEVNFGKIEVHSEYGKGSTFILWLPINQETA